MSDPISLQYADPLAPTEAPNRWLAERTSSLARAGYKLTTQSGALQAYTRRYTPGIAVVLGILTFPIGILLWLFWRREEAFTMEWAPYGGGSLVTVRGEAPPNVRATFEAIAAEHNAAYAAAHPA